MAKKSLAYAVIEGIQQEMLRDEDVIFLYEVDNLGSVTAAYTGLSALDLRKSIGKPRVEFSGISENWYTGAAFGACRAGCRPIASHIAGYVPSVHYHQVHEQPLLFSSSMGDDKLPCVILQPMNSQGGAGAGTYSGNYDYDSLYMRIPCLKVVVPTTAYDAKGMMISSIRTNDPVLFLQGSALNNVADEVPDGLYEVPIGKCAIRQEGKDLTIVTSGPGVVECDIAVETLKKEGISVEYIDLRTLRPLDRKTFVESVRKTGHLLTVDHSYYTLCPGAEVIATCAQGVPGAKFRRLAFPDVTACSAIEFGNWYKLKPDQIVLAAKMLLKD
jgi:pyruvate/2-oxoglutarate/acetoin dehydrogenase E1 component